MKYLKKFNESKDDYYVEIPEDDFWEIKEYYNYDTLPFTNREIEMIKSICDSRNTELKYAKVIDLNDEVYELQLITKGNGVDDFGSKFVFQRRSLIYKMEDEYFLFGFNVDRESSSTFYKADQIDGLLKLLSDEL
jgi:hypothetical protein